MFADLMPFPRIIRPHCHFIYYLIQLARFNKTNKTDVQGTKPTSKKTTQAIRWQQIAQELDRRKSSGSDAESIEALVFARRNYESPWVEALNNYFGGYVRINNLFSNPFPCPLSIFFIRPPFMVGINHFVLVNFPCLSAFK